MGLAELYLSENQIENLGAEALAAALGELTNLTRLEVSSNAFESSRFASLSRKL